MTHAESRIRNTAALEALRQGRSLADVAAEFGMRSVTLRVYATTARIPLPRRPRKPRMPKQKQPLTQQQLEIVAFYETGNTLRATGARFGISGERVRQLIVKHEVMSGTTVPRNQHGVKTGTLRVARIVWRCPDCGVERRLTPKAAASPERCASCWRRSNDPTCARWAVALSGGTPPMVLARADGVHYQTVLVGVWLYLKRHGRLAEVPIIYKGLRIGWLERKYGR